MKLRIIKDRTLEGGAPRLFDLFDSSTSRLFDSLTFGLFDPSTF
jgi:hypothetical protein